MSSVTSHILNHTRTGGHFIGLGVTNAKTYTTYTAPTSSATGFINSAGSVFNFTISGTTPATNALAALAAAIPNAGSATLAAGQLLEDMGDRIVFSAGGQTIAIMAKVRDLSQASYEGDETPLYTCIWSGSPALFDTDKYQAIVGVARL